MKKFALGKRKFEACSESDRCDSSSKDSSRINRYIVFLVIVAISLNANCFVEEAKAIAKKTPSTTISMPTTILLNNSDWITAEVAGYIWNPKDYKEKDDSDYTIGYYKTRLRKGFKNCQDGTSTYSFGTATAIADGGDVCLMSVKRNGKHLFALGFDVYVDLGVFKRLPQKLTLPSKVDAKTCYAGWKLGHYYICSLVSNKSVIYLVHPLSFQVKEVEREKHWYGDNVLYNYTLSFKYLVLEDKNPPKSNPLPNSTINILSKKYETFQKTIRTYFDASSEDSSLAECDQYIKMGRAIEEELAFFLIDKKTGAENNRLKIEELNKRLSVIKSTQIKDRIVTLINALKVRLKEQEEQARAWSAKRNELQITLEELGEYRKVLEIVGRK